MADACTDALSQHGRIGMSPAGSQLLLPALVEIGGAVGRVTAVSRTVLVRHFSNPLSLECEPAMFSLGHPPCRVSGASQAAAGGRHSCAVVRHPDGSEAVFSFGRGEEGQLGHGSTQDSAVSQSPCRKSWRAFTPASCAYGRHRPKLSRS